MTLQPKHQDFSWQAGGEVWTMSEGLRTRRACDVSPEVSRLETQEESVFQIEHEGRKKHYPSSSSQTEVSSQP
jgi:hypothetical protein